MEKLSLWNRFFNRYKRVIIEDGKETFSEYYPLSDFLYPGQKIPNSDYERCFVKYKIIDRLTGSERIEKEYLD
jgi:hypothetical protein